MRVRLLTLAALAAVALTACGGSKSDDKSSGPATTAAPSSPASTAPDSPEAAAVRTVYTQFVDPNVALAAKVAMLQDGPAFRSSLEALSRSDYAKKVSLAITSITVTSAKQASLTFDVLLSGSPLVRAQQGFAVNENGTWKIAGITFCGLLAAQGPVPPVCSTAAATTLPG